MKKIISSISLLGVVLSLLVSPAFSATNVSGHSVVIDAGHGGSDSGSMECSGYPEKDANLDIANKLKDKLEANGATVHMTRTDDSTLSNNDRYEFANSTDGEVLVSVHLNGSTDHSVNGTLGLYGKKKKDQPFTETMHSRLANELGVPDSGTTNFASGVLLKSDMPATIQETVFISNTDECANLTDGTGDRQQEIADSLYNGLNDWFAESSGGDEGGDDDDEDNGSNCPPNSNAPHCR